MQATAPPSSETGTAVVEPCPYGVDRDAWGPDTCPCSSTEVHLTVVVFGATGDLAEKKTFPALAALYMRGCVRLSQCCRALIWPILELLLTQRRERRV